MMEGFSQELQRIQTICLMILTAIAVAAALYWLRPVMIPFVLSVFCVTALSMAVDFLTNRFSFPKPIAMATAIVGMVIGFLLLAGVVMSSVRELANNAGGYQSSVMGMMDRLFYSLDLGRFGVSQEEMREYYKTPVRSIGSVLLGTTNAILDLLSRSTLVIIFIIFLLVGSPGSKASAHSMWVEIESKIRRYIATKIAISAATGLVVGVILTVLGVDLAVAFGLMAFLLNFIPSLGSIIATLMPLPVVLVSPESGPLTVGLTLLLPGTVQLIVGNVLEPKVMGDSLAMHPVVILMALIFWGMLWGIVGMFLAVPITASIKIILSRFSYTRSIALLLEGNLSALEPKEPE